MLAEKLRALNARVRDHPAEEDRPARAAAPAGRPAAGRAAQLAAAGLAQLFPAPAVLRALRGPGELVGYLAALESAPHAAAARVREPAWLLELPAKEFLAQYQGNTKLQHAIHLSLLPSLSRTNTQLTRLISHARLTSSTRAALELEKALHGQVVNVKNQ